ncbi:MAG TPA: hypothetical protein DCS13_06035 [Candidatus Margulisbacteria bacterium]|nr:MAG: hypothetical protein A2X43_05925 [Candidatus Margulisbacteria bacterium GWD2_39_127]OGI10353.1 MAG: hypothetical protein A2X41_11775 [Candidatus Margulisbacteria bacterium GWE2_39_32]HAR63009.1 hypothetical protein [Candidatus Margulisiibacteriota bacterium]
MKNKTLYCSYYYKHRSEYDNITKIYAGTGSLSIQNKDFCEDNPRKLLTQMQLEIQNYMNPADTLVMLIEDDTHNKGLAQFMINYAAQKDKEVVAIFLPGKALCKIPPALIDLNFKRYKKLSLIKYDDESIIDSLNGLYSWDD